MEKIMKNTAVAISRVLSDDAFLKDLISVDGPIAPFDSPEYVVLPGFCDVHVHFREPGFSYKETMITGSMSAAHGGYTAVCTMPNLKPVPDNTETLKLQLEAINKCGKINIYPYGAITMGEMGTELADIEAMFADVIGFSDDGKGVQNDELMLKAMVEVKRLGGIIAAHCEDNSKLHGGYIHDGEYAKNHGHKGISSASEYAAIERDLYLAEKTGCKYHVCHISTKESVDIIRKAKAKGVDVTCETGPHYLVMDDSDLKEDGRFKMNPPLRSKEDRIALVEGLCDGTIDMIATDHAPHSAEEKAKGLEKSAFGVVGLETAFPVLYTKLVKEKIITLDKLVELMAINPRKRFNIPFDRDYTVWNLNERFTVDPAEFLSMGKATPFEGMSFYGKCVLTVCGGKVVYRY